jgi:glycosyltransferase involved in cell wall biosynthesis
MKKIKISICIPTFNRFRNLDNLLNSIVKNEINNKPIEVIVSDNASKDKTEAIVSKYYNKIKIKYIKNTHNLGMAKNIINCTKSANGEFIWILGDDDLLFNNSLREIINVINKNSNCDFFLFNSLNIPKNKSLKYLKSNSLINLENFSKFSKIKFNKKDYLKNNINYNDTSDFLGAIFTTIFRNKIWQEGIKVFNNNKLIEKKKFFSLESTFPHTIIFALKFLDKRSFFSTSVVSMNINNLRDWLEYYPVIRSIRINQIIDLYRKQGLNFSNFFKSKNSNLKYIIPDLARIYLFKSTRKGYISIYRDIIKNLMFPNFYLSPIHYILKKIYYDKKQND